MILHGLQGDEQLIRNLLIGAAGIDALHDVRLPLTNTKLFEEGGEALRVVRLCPWRAVHIDHDQCRV